MTKAYPFEFTGRGGEYFRIWIVNLALTLATLGVYSAWAKVRTERWFYGHTRLDGHAFSYHAQPLQILKGRALAVAALILYFVAETFVPLLALVLLGLFFLALPWIVVNAWRFHARQSGWRGLRFDFSGRYGEAARVYTLWPLLLVPTFGLILPYLMYRQARFRADHSHYGDAGSRFETGSGPYWRLYLKLLAFSFLAAIPVSILLTSLLATLMPDRETAEAPAALSGGIALVVLAVYGYFFVLAAWLKARSANLFYSSTRFESFTAEAGFVSTQRARDLAWLYVSNLVLIALTLGVFIPWAKVRLARYRAARLTLTGPQDLGVFGAAQRKQADATGGEVADIFDIDVGLA